MMKRMFLAFAIAGLCLHVVGAPKSQDKRRSIKWEYEVVYGTSDIDLRKYPADFAERKKWVAAAIKKKFNAIGAKGWELVSYDRKSDVAVFKRMVRTDNKDASAAER